MGGWGRRSERDRSPGLKYLSQDGSDSRRPCSPPFTGIKDQGLGRVGSDDADLSLGKAFPPPVGVGKTVQSVDINHCPVWVCRLHLERNERKRSPISPATIT